MRNLIQSIIVFKDRCYMALCGNKPQESSTCGVIHGVDEYGTWKTQDVTAESPVNADGAKPTLSKPSSN